MVAKNLVQRSRVEQPTLTDLGARRALQNNPWQFVKPRLSGRTYMAYGITAPTPPRGDSGKGSIVIAITS